MALEVMQLREIFLNMSVELTGFDRSIIAGTGQVDQNFRAIRLILETRAFDAFLKSWNPKKPFTLEQKNLPIANNVVRAWYLGRWAALSNDEATALGLSAFNTAGFNQVLSPAAYEEALAWSVIHAHPPGAKEPGFQSWTETPV